MLGGGKRAGILARIGGRAHRGAGCARIDGGHADARFAGFIGQDLGEPLDGEFAHCVRAPVGAALAPDGRRGEQHRCVGCGFQCGHQRGAQFECSVDVHLHQAPPGIAVVVSQWHARAKQSGIVEQTIELAVVLDGLLGKLLIGTAIRGLQVAGDDHRVGRRVCCNPIEDPFEFALGAAQ